MSHIEEVSLSLTVSLTPTPSFVVKTKVASLPEHNLTGATYALGQKIFLNICSNALVPLPPTPFHPTQTFPLIMENAWEIPIIVSRERTATDKQGVVCSVYDCMVNDSAMEWIHADSNLRMIAIEWCLESIEYNSLCTVSREYAIPKMKFKGEVVATELLLSELAGRSGMQHEMERLKEDEVIGLILESREDDDELPALFPLTTTARPLIQEISELSIEEKEGTKGLKTEVKLVTGAPKDIRKLQFRVSFHKLTGNHKLQIKISNEHLTSSFDYRLAYLKDSHVLVVESCVESTVVINNALEIPLPVGMGTGFESFYIKDEAALCVFIR
ncbi:hypothetical protein BABINDRAFT_163482 [Babjeviella inositovora NRRL Y-12698]|uniref:PIH1 N-terminal domain-containing protein n=1 Tax=Babjeviella inositovora NRRL Y-12698 TaxID=984486 RepID=A0A1E3QIF1_9ASCO|nr:uncharacterized protein BABINDRAFT_163482 [Babjeviella inositovora NRRL Y-12698]ODQ77471.1 hypothetical protein BABINDRAFT_163482 [Babjeviella inositovora NRRL Y-12698]